MRLFAHIVGTALLVIGLAVLLGVGGVYGYSVVERVMVERELALTPIPTMVPTPTEAPTETPTSTPSAQPTGRPTGTPTAVATPTPATPTKTPVPTATPIPRPAQRIIAPKINLDSRVVEAPISNGQWQVPKFVAGHLQLTANPGEAGNIVFAGHVESLSSGNVFANLDGLSVGDPITVQTDAAEFHYVVAEKRIVKNDDLSVVDPTPQETLTLITCYGTFLPATRDYDRRLVISAKRAPTGAPAAPTARPQ